VGIELATFGLGLASSIAIQTELSESIEMMRDANEYSMLERQSCNKLIEKLPYLVNYAISLLIIALFRKFWVPTGTGEDTEISAEETG
jgi:hypothetical protein